MDGFAQSCESDWDGCSDVLDNSDEYLWLASVTKKISRTIWYPIWRSRTYGRIGCGVARLKKVWGYSFVHNIFIEKWSCASIQLDHEIGFPTMMDEKTLTLLIPEYALDVECTLNATFICPSLVRFRFVLVFGKCTRFECKRDMRRAGGNV